MHCTPHALRCVTGRLVPGLWEVRIAQIQRSSVGGAHPKSYPTRSSDPPDFKINENNIANIWRTVPCSLLGRHSAVCRPTPPSPRRAAFLICLMTYDGLIHHVRTSRGTVAPAGAHNVPPTECFCKTPGERAWQQPGQRCFLQPPVEKIQSLWFGRLGNHLSDADRRPTGSSCAAKLKVKIPPSVLLSLRTALQTTRRTR